jgi:hypothetical protein
MTKSPSYIIVGKGRWGTRIHAMLNAEGRRANFAERVRRQLEESSSDYKSRLMELFTSSSAQIAWLCVPPGSHVASLCAAALAAGLHVIVEKPWLCSPEETKELQVVAQAKDLTTGVHFEYCLLSEVERWRRDYQQGAAMEFSGIFTLNRGDRLGLPPIHNLGSHLLAIRQYSVYNSKIAAIQCDYESADARAIWLDAPKRRVATIDFLGNKEPIVQRYVDRFEASLNGLPFPFDLKFAMSVTEEITVLNNSAGQFVPTPSKNSV